MDPDVQVLSETWFLALARHYVGPSHWFAFRQLRNKCTSEISKAKSNYYLFLIPKSYSSPTPFATLTTADGESISDHKKIWELLINILLLVTCLIKCIQDPLCPLLILISVCVDKLDPYFLKLAASGVVSYIKYIFNLSVFTGTVHRVLKAAYVTQPTLTIIGLFLNETVIAVTLILNDIISAFKDTQISSYYWYNTYQRQLIIHCI